MKKIPTIFKRDFSKQPALVTPEINPECQWVFDGEGWPTRKLNGMCCMIQNGQLYKRRDVKKGKPFPPGFELIETDNETGKSVGWVRVSNTASEDKYFWEAFCALTPKSDGTYELVGPKVQGGVEGYEKHYLISHISLDLHMYFNVAPFDDLGTRSYGRLAAWLARHRDIEGIVFHHEDGRMAKIKLKDFGLKRMPRE